LVALQAGQTTCKRSLVSDDPPEAGFRESALSLTRGFVMRKG